MPVNVLKLCSLCHFYKFLDHLFLEQCISASALLYPVNTVQLHINLPTTGATRDLKQICCSAECRRLLAQCLCKMDVIMLLQLGCWQLPEKPSRLLHFCWLSVSKQSHRDQGQFNGNIPGSLSTNGRSGKI